jgi:hypothetical protein
MNNFCGETLFEEKGFPAPLPKTFLDYEKDKVLCGFIVGSAQYLVVSFVGKFLKGVRGKLFSKSFPR